ncbi:MAG: hypothetical protein ACHQNV_04275 [Vicinamibacteria bacterium]
MKPRTVTPSPLDSSAQPQAPRALSLAVVSVFIVTLLMGLLLPIYTDEITWKAATARTFLDGNVNIWMFPQCGASFAVAPPWFMLPARLIDHWLYADLSEPGRLRLIGAGILACWIALLVAALPRPVGVSRWSLVSVGAGILGLGVLPFILMMNRPEQLMRLLISLFLVAPFIVKPARPRSLRALGGALLVALLASILLAQHPKSLYFMPVVVASAAYVVPGAVLRSTTIGALGVLAWRTAVHWYSRLSCAADPRVELFTNRKMLNPAGLLSSKAEDLAPYMENLSRSARYVTGTLFQHSYPVNWLVDAREALPFEPAVNMLITSVWVGVGALGAWTLARFAVEAIKTRKLPRQAVMAFSLFVPLVGCCLLETHKAFYESSLVLPFLAVILALGRHPPRDPFWLWVGRAGAAAVLLVSLASLAILWGTVLPNLGPWLARGYVPGQPLSISAFGAEDLRERVQLTARLCGLDPSRTADNLIVDDLTYTAVENLRRPVFGLYAFPRTERDPLGMLAARSSPGVVASCDRLPTAVVRQSLRVGFLCCAAPPWNRVPK